MTPDDRADTLVRLIWRVPVLAINLDAARRAGDDAALSYAKAMAAWRAEAAQAVAAAMATSPARTCDAQPDAYARTAVAAELIQRQAAVP